jgi:uncharacterized protein (DUF433 family)
MTDEELRASIVTDPNVLVGQPCIRGTRLTVRFIVNLLAHGASVDQILAEYPRLTHDDLRACLLYAADLLNNKRADELFDSDQFVTVSEWSGADDRDSRDSAADHRLPWRGWAALHRTVTDEQLREQITIDPKIMVGQPCIRGTRIPVRLILGLLAHSASLDEIFEDYPRLTHDDVSACLLFAVDLLDRVSSASIATSR